MHMACTCTYVDAYNMREIAASHMVRWIYE